MKTTYAYWGGIQRKGNDDDRGWMVENKKDCGDEEGVKKTYKVKK